MWCPKCRSEFREGFEYCAACDADLVAELSSEEAGPSDRGEDRETAEEPIRQVKRMEFCGFFSLDEAAGARSSLAEVGLSSEILIRDAPRLQGEDAVRDEFWLRVDPDDIALVRKVLDMMESENPADGPEPLRCPECNAKLDARDRLCLGCGTTITVADDA